MTVFDTTLGHHTNTECPYNTNIEQHRLNASKLISHNFSISNFSSFLECEHLIRSSNYRITETQIGNMFGFFDD